MRTPSGDRIVLIIESIKHYLEDHPKAADAIEGIANWWLGGQCYPQTQEEIQQALDYLVDKGVIRKTELISGRVVYSNTESKQCEC